MINNEKKSIYAEDIMIQESSSDNYFTSKSLRNSISYKQSCFIKTLNDPSSIYNISNEKDQSNSIIKSNNQVKRRSSSSFVKIIDNQVYYNLIYGFEEDRKIRKDKFGVEIRKSNNNNHKIKFAPDENLVIIKKVMSYSRITRKLNKEASNQTEGFCFVF